MAFNFECSEAIHPNTRLNFKSLVQTVLDHAPSDASCEAIFDKDDGPYRATIRVHCQDVELRGSTTGHCSQEVLTSLGNEMFRQIRQWREMRHLNATYAL